MSESKEGFVCPHCGDLDEHSWALPMEGETICETCNAAYRYEKTMRYEAYKAGVIETILKLYKTEYRLSDRIRDLLRRMGIMK